MHTETRETDTHKDTHTLIYDPIYRLPLSHSMQVHSIIFTSTTLNVIDWRAHIITLTTRKVWRNNNIKRGIFWARQWLARHATSGLPCETPCDNTWSYAQSHTDTQTHALHQRISYKKKLLYSTQSGILDHPLLILLCYKMERFGCDHDGTILLLHMCYNVGVVLTFDVFL